MRNERSSTVLPLQGALIGFGNAAIHAHLPVWKENTHFRIRAVVEPRSERVILARRMLPGVRIYARMEELLGREKIDFVDICTPPCFHGDLMLRACLAGLHVFCEKPLVTKAEESVPISRIAENRDLVVFAVNNWKYAPLWARVGQIVRRGLIGPVRKVDLSVLRTPGSGGGVLDWRRNLLLAGGGILLDHGWHHLYLILSLIPDWPTDIAARMDFPESGNTSPEEVVDLFMRFPRAEAELHLTWRSTSRGNFGTIKGDRGTILIRDDHLIVDLLAGQPLRINFAEPLSAGSHHREWMRPVVEAFYHEIKGVSPRGGNLAEALRCLRLIELAYRSYRQGACFVRVENNNPLERDSP